jgi:transposase/transposase-like protein
MLLDFLRRIRMERTEDVQVTRRTARRRFSEQFKRELVEQALRPDVSLTALAQANDVNPNQLARWRRLHLQARASATLVPVTIMAQPMPVTELATPASVARTGEIEWRHGQTQLVVRGDVDVAVVRAIIEKLELEVGQLELKLEELLVDNGEDPPPATPASEARVERARKRLPEHLRRDTIVHKPAAKACPDCGGALKQIGEDVAEQLEYVRQSWRVIRHVRPKWSCACCQTLVQASAPSRPIARGLAGPGLLAHVTVSKFADHLPLYRQTQIYARDGLELERSTLSEWVGGVSRLLRPLVDAVRRYVMAGSTLHADDTPVPMLAPGKGKTATGRLWAYVREESPTGSSQPAAVWMAFTPDRRGERTRKTI